MQVHYNIGSLPEFKKAVITIGTFDGVHLGHQQIIDQLIAEAKRIDGESLIISFHPHPKKIIEKGNSQVLLLTSLQEKIKLLEAKGIDHLVVVPFNEAFAEQTAAEYVHDFLFKQFHPHTVIIGYDHRFGKGRTGDYHLLEEYGKKLGFEVKEIPEHVLNEVTISSTCIREALLKGYIDTAKTFLGYDYFFEGKVIRGNQLGRTLGYPTANIEPLDVEKLIPGNGVYAVEVEFPATGNRQRATRNIFKGMMNIGVRPTIGGVKRVIEVNIFDFDADIYDQTIRVYVKYFLRSEVKFNGLDALKEQLAKDKENALKIL